jgi:hypothetical protein
MFWRFAGNKSGIDKFGRTFDEAYKEHALWCIETLKNNKPDDDEAMDYLNNNCVSWNGCPHEFTPYLHGIAAFNAFCEIKACYEEFKKYYTDDENKWIESWRKKTT